MLRIMGVVAIVACGVLWWWPASHRGEQTRTIGTEDTRLPAMNQELSRLEVPTASQQPTRTAASDAGASSGIHAYKKLRVHFLTSAGLAPREGLRVQVRNKASDTRLGQPVALDRDGAAEVNVPVTGDALRLELLGTPVRFLLGTPEKRAAEKTLESWALPTTNYLEDEVSYRMRRERWIIRGRVLGREGEPLAAETVRFIGYRASQVGDNKVRLSLDGRFEFECWMTGAELGDIKSLQIKHRATRDGQATVVETLAPLLLFSRPVRGVADLGDIRLGGGAVVAAGTIAYEGGESLSDATFALEFKQRTVGAIDEQWFRRNCEAKIEGQRFYVRANVSGEQMRLVPGAAGVEFEPVEFELGDDDLSIRVERRGSISARVDLRKGVDIAQLRVTGYGPGAPAEGAPFSVKVAQSLATSLYPERRGVVMATGLLPGRWDVVMSVGRDEILRVSGVQVDAGVNTRDPRLMPMQIPDRLRTIIVTSTFADDTSRFVALDVHGPQGWTRVKNVTRRSRLSYEVLVLDAVDLRLSSEGYRTVYEHGVTGDIVVLLHPGLPIELTLDALPVAHHDPDWQVTLIHAESGVAVEGSLEALDGRRGQLLVYVGEPGTYDVRLTHARRGSWMHFREGATVGNIDIRNAAERQFRAVRVPANFFELSR